MKRAMCFILLGMLAGFNAFGISKDYLSKAPDTGISTVNGHGWNGFSKKEKELYARGLSDVLSSCSIARVIMDNSTMDQETIDFIESLSNLIPEDLPYEEMEKSLDDFYAKKDNLIIPIVAAYFSVLVEKNEWAEPEAIESSVDRLRKYYRGELKLEEPKEEAGEAKSGETQVPSEEAVKPSAEPEGSAAETGEQLGAAVQGAQP